MHSRTPLIPALLVVLAWPWPLSAAAAEGPERPRNVILMIADGCGPASMTLAREVSGAPLTLDGILAGSVTTWSSSSRVTDSAAGATALASGVKTANGVVGVDERGRRAVTLLERARERGMGTGLVVKSTITDATPGAFAAHAHSRSAQDSIAVQEIEAGVDVLLGGGRRWFLPTSRGGARKDSLDLISLARERGYATIGNRAELRTVKRTPVLGLFAAGSMSYALDRDTIAEPSLPEMATKALTLLGGGSQGFFLMIEGSRIDHAGHANDPAAHAREVLEYDEAVRRVLDFARRDGRTLVVCTADHETGGLSLGLRIGDRSFYELRPQNLRGVTSSLERMTDSIWAGADPAGVVTRCTGAPLTDDERALLMPAIKEARGKVEEPDLITRALSQIVSGRALIGWSTGGHTAVDVGLHAFGPGSDHFRGTLDNTRVARILAGLMGIELSPAAQADAATGPR